jgi:threonine synthase
MYRCRSCGNTYPQRGDAPWRCSCGEPLDFAEPPEFAGQPPRTLERDEGIWAFEDWLAVSRQVSLGEGWTPLVEAPDRPMTYKLEWLFPTGSFKDRGAATTISHAMELDVARVVEDSSGNAGAAIATYAARAGLDADIFVPDAAKPAKLKAIEQTGATVRRISGDRQAVTEACHAELAADGSDAWYASHAWNPAFFEGTATIASEIAAQRDWTAPDAMVMPLGHGTLFQGAYRGFRRLEAAGWIDSIPRLYGAQAAGSAPIVADRHGEGAAAGSNAVADGIQIREPPQRAHIHEAIDQTDGDVIAVDAERTDQVLTELHQRGFPIEPTCAVAPAAYDKLRDDGEIELHEEIIVPLTGTSR